MATPHHLARSRRSSGDGIRSALYSVAPGSSDPGSLPLLHKPARRSLRRAVWRNPKSLPPSLCGRGERANPGSTAAQHAPGAVLRDGCVLPRAHLTHFPPAALLHGAPCGAPILQRHERHGCRCLVPLIRTHTHLQPHAAVAAQGMQAQASGMLLLLCRTLWRAPLVPQPPTPIHRVAAAPAISPPPSPQRPHARPPSPAPSPHSASPLPAKRAAFARENLGSPLGQRHSCTQGAACLHYRHSRLAAPHTPSFTPLVQHAQSTPEKPRVS